MHLFPPALAQWQSDQRSFQIRHSSVFPRRLSFSFSFFAAVLTFSWEGNRCPWPRSFYTKNRLRARHPSLPSPQHPSVSSLPTSVLLDLGWFSPSFCCRETFGLQHDTSTFRFKLDAEPICFRVAIPRLRRLVGPGYRCVPISALFNFPFLRQRRACCFFFAL